MGGATGLAPVRGAQSPSGPLLKLILSLSLLGKIVFLLGVPSKN